MERSNVALTKCFLCGCDSDILLATKYNKKGEPIHDMKKYHGKVVNTKPCQKCEEYIKQGVILISVRNDAKDAYDAFRTGGFAIIKREALKEMGFEIPKCGFAFIQDSLWERMGLPLSDYQKELLEAKKDTA